MSAVTRAGRALDTMSYPNFADLRDRNTVFDEVAAYRPTPEAFGLAVNDSAQAGVRDRGVS
jgi:hypothetical protein